MKLPNPYTQRKLAEAGNLPPHDGPLAAVNMGFHQSYNRVVEQVLAELGERVPVVVVIGDDATLLCDGGEQREQVIPARYHEVKALAHLAFGVQLTLMANGTGRLTELTTNELHEKRAQIREAHATAAATTASNAPAELLSCAHTLVDSVLAEGAVDFERLQKDIRALASHALDMAQLAVCIELDQLHALVGRWRNHLGEARWAGLYVVVCSGHQPRYREATCQYFGRLLHQPEGSGAEREDRLVYAEGLCDIDSALDLLARHIVDQRASNLLFGDRRRLQEDLLADAAATEVRKLLPKLRRCSTGAHR